MIERRVVRRPLAYLLVMPRKPREIVVTSNLKPSIGLRPWERELLLPVALDVLHRVFGSTAPATPATKATAPAAPSPVGSSRSRRRTSRASSPPTPPAIESVPMQVHGVARTRMNFANTHLLHAHRFALQAHTVETAHAGHPFGAFTDEIMAAVVASVLSSMAALEAYVNEVAFEPTEHFRNTSPELVRSSLIMVERQPLLDRLAFLAVLNGMPKPDLGKNPGQSVATLVELRNALVHFRPEWPDEQKAHAKLVSGSGRSSP